MQYGRLLLTRTQLFLPSYWSATFTLFNQSRQLDTLILKSIIIICYSEWYKQPKFQRLIFIIHFPLVCVLKGEHEGDKSMERKILPLVCSVPLIQQHPENASFCPFSQQLSPRTALYKW